MKKKIVYCLPSLYISGGMERVLTIKANYFAEVLGYEIYIILTDGVDKNPFFKLSPLIKVINLNINFEELWEFNFLKKTCVFFLKQRKYKQKLKETLFSIRPDFTITMLRREINFINDIADGSIKIGELHVNRENFRNLVVSHNNIVTNILSKVWMLQLIFKLKKLSAFVVLCNEEKEKWVELNNIVVINNPLPFYPIESSNLLSHKVIAVGRLTHQKGFDILIKAWKFVTDKFPDWELSIYGSGEIEKHNEQIKKFNIKKTCCIKDPVSDIISKYCESSIFVLSSRYEGFGMVIIEAMSCGVPPIAFDCPSGPKDIINNLKDGILVKSGDINELADKICFLIENEDIRKEMGINARKSSERFKIEHIAMEWESLFEKLVKNKTINKD